jgi:cellulose synthase/poly-beta-1,6-N-acetylglucosamine synthase-like glycosyltransferase
MIVSTYIFFIAIGILVYSYAFYPLLLKLLANGKEPNNKIFDSSALPSISILIAAHNEENVITEKLQSIFNSNYPKEKIEVYVGSDASTDSTNRIVENLTKSHPTLKLLTFERQGKVRIINKLAELASSPILIITDANVIFEKDALANLTKHFSNKNIGLVDSHMQHKSLNEDGISHEESFYIKSEVSIKNNEGLIWGTMMGPFGGCYAVRKDCFTPVPEHFLVDDFYVNMKVLEKGMHSINEPNAIVYEDVSNDLTEEFRRKIRIATGSWQNLFCFIPALFRFNAISFCFLSHKVIRWKGPVLFILLYLSTFILMNQNQFFNFFFWLETLLLLCVPLDYILQKAGLHIRILRLIRHFFFMNLAILIGMLRAIFGVKSSIWQPTRRHQ